MSKSRVEKMEARSIKHAARPKVGDYWHECFVPICYVIAVTDQHVTYLSKTIPDGPDHFRFDETKPEVKTRAEFQAWLHYNSEEYGHKTWGFVITAKQARKVRRRRARDEACNMAQAP